MGNEIKNARGKASLALVIVAILYAIWPLDFMPGVPVDDFVLGVIALVGTFMSNSRIGEGQ